MKIRPKQDSEHIETPRFVFSVAVGTIITKAEDIGTITD